MNKEVKNEYENLKSEDNFLNYSFQQLQFSDNFKGGKHLITSNMQFGNTSFYSNSSFLSNNSDIQDNTFLRVKAGVEHHFLKSWFGGFLNIE